MNRELEALILAYEAVSAARDTEAEQRIEFFESLLDEVLNGHPGTPREILRKSVIKAHRQWALKQEQKPPPFPRRREFIFSFAPMGGTVTFDFVGSARRGRRRVGRSHGGRCSARCHGSHGRG